VLDIEIKELSFVLGSIKLKESDDSLVVKLTETLMQNEKEYWKNVAQAMTDCQNTLAKFAGILQTVNSGMT
jgi:lipopolysaccharide biosynthesis regulator YciM